MWHWLRRLARIVRGEGRMSPDQAAMLARYQHLRRVGLELNNRLLQLVSKSIFDEGGKKLGILKKNVLVLDSEDEMAVLADYCIHDVRRQGANAIDRYLAKSPPPPESDEMVLLQALRHAYFSLFAVESTEPGVGAHVRDLLRDEPLFVVDVGFSRTASRGMVLATRVMAPEGIWMTTGAALPVGVLPAAAQAGFRQDMAEDFPGMDFRRLSPQQASELSARIIRSCLRQGAAEHIQYVEPTKLPGGRGPVSAAAPAARPVRRNQPCPCGSGKKFKHCCGAPR
jgi:hypothetical protein